MAVVGSFLVDGCELGVAAGRSRAARDGGHVTLEVRAATVPAAAAAWAHEPPVLYLRSVPLPARGRLVIGADELDAHDIALYLVEHHDVEGVLEEGVDGLLRFRGAVVLPGGETWSLDVAVGPVGGP